MANNIKPSKSYKNFLNNPNIYNFYLYPTNKVETYMVIKNLKAKHSCGHDNISPKLLKENPHQLAEPITHTINLSFQNAKVPQQFKLAKVIPIFKKNDKINSDNYGLISFLSTINKRMENIMYKRLITFLNTHNILYNYQFGFRENHSTSLALIEIVDNILKDMEEGKLVAGIFLYRSKALDTNDHEILLDKLQHYRIQWQLHDWFRSYLDNR